tara:strand:- start:2235 stop:3287 length:1053 start_codon:yes stop_codon:yes gene_type:complete
MKILCTLGPSTLNKLFLKLSSRLGISLLRLNMSHIKINKLKNHINIIRKYTKIPICIDSEGAQIRTGDLNKNKKLSKNSLFKIFRKNNNKKNLITFYPEEVFDQIKPKDKLTIDFNSVVIKILNKNNNHFTCKVLRPGIISGNKAATLNRDIILPSLTKKDVSAFKIGKKLNIKNFAVSFVSQKKDIILARKIVGKKSKIISKVETFKALENLIEITKATDIILIDRGDLSRQVPLSSIPSWQKIISKVVKKYNKKLFIATNLLETMINSENPTRAEINDIYNCISDGADGLVLAAETAIGKYPIDAVKMIKDNVKNYKTNYKNQLSKINQNSINKIVRQNKKKFLKKFI